MLFPFKFTSWLTEALLSSVYFSQRNRPRIGNKQRMYVSAVTKLVYWDASRKISVRLYTFVASYFICFRSRNTSWQVTSVVHQKYRKTIQTRVLSVCPDETFPKYRKKLDFYKKTTETTKSGMKYLRSVSKCHCLIPTNSSATRAHSSETWLIINTFPRNICMSFTKYVEVVENSAIMNMLSANVTV